MRKDLTVQEREEEDRLFAELKKRREEAKNSGDDNARWVRRRGKVINIGKYKATEEGEPSQADRSPQEGEKWE